MDEKIPKSSKLQWINTTLKFLKNDNQLMMEYPEMPVQHMEYLHKLIWQHNNVELGNKSIYSSVWEAMKIVSLKYSFKVCFNTSEGGNTGILAIEKILKEYQGNDKAANDNMDNSKQPRKIEAKSSKSSTLKTREHTPKQDKFFTDCRKIIDSISPAILRKGLQKMLDFLYSKMDASVIFSDLAPIEARFYENFLGIYNRRCEFQGLFSPACNDLLEKMSEFFKEFDKECKLEVYPSKHNMDFKKREVQFMKVPRYTRKKATSSPVLKTTSYTEKANITSMSVPSAENNVNSCINNVSSKSNIINKKLSMSNAIHKLPSMSSAINKLSASSSTKNISSSTLNNVSNAIKTNKDNVAVSSAIDNTSSNAINNMPSTTGSNKLLPLFSVTNDTLSKSSALSKIPASSAIKNISTVDTENKKPQITSNIMPSGSNAKNNVPTKSSAMNNVPSSSSGIKTEDSTSNTTKQVQSPSHLSINHVPPSSSALKIQSASNVEKNIVSALSAKKEVPTPCTINKVSFLSSDKSVMQSASNTINNKPTRKEKLLKAMSTPLESEKGLRMMRSMGWDGGALGLRGEGLIEPIIPALHIVPGAGLGHEAPIKTKTKTTKSKTKVDPNATKAVRINNRLIFLTTILDLLQRDKSITNVTYPISLAKKEILTFENIVDALNMRSSYCLTSVENVSLERIQNIMAQNTQLGLHLDFSRDMSELMIVKYFDEQIERRLQRKNNKKQSKSDTTPQESNMSEQFSKDDLALHVCGEILKFIKCEDTKMVIAFDAVQVDRYEEFVRRACECINRKVLIPFAPVRHLAIDILKTSQDSCVELHLDINKKSFVLHKTCYPSKNQRTKVKHDDDMNTKKSINMLQQEEAAFANNSNNTSQQSKKECQRASTSAISSSKIRVSHENKPPPQPPGNIDKICKQIDSILGNLDKYNSPNDVKAKITHTNVDVIECDEIRTDEFNRITNNAEAIIVSDEETDDKSSQQLLGSAKNATNASLSVLEENKEQINFTQNIYERIDFLLEKLENYEKTKNTRANSLHKYVDNINNNKIVQTASSQNDKHLNFNETDSYCKENNKGIMIVDGTDVGETSLNKINVSKKQVDEDMNIDNLSEEVDPIINNLGKDNKRANSSSEVVMRNENDNNNNSETASYIFLVDTHYYDYESHNNVDEKLSRYSRKYISAVTPVLIQNNNLIGDSKKLEQNSHNSGMSKVKETNELNNLKPISCNTDNFICTKENRKFRKRTKKRAVISIETDNFKNINENLVENAIEALTSHSRTKDNIDEIKMHKEIIKTNNYSKDSVKVNDHLKSAKPIKISERIDELNEMATYISRKWYEHYDNFLKCDELEKIHAHNPDNKEDLVTYIDENDTLIEKDLKPINIDVNAYSPEEIENTNFKCNDKAKSTIFNVALNEPPHSILIDEISVKFKNLTIGPDHSNTVIDNVYREVENVLDKAGIENTLVLEPEVCRHLINATDALNVLEKVEKVSIDIDTKESQNIIELIGSNEILNERREKESTLEIVEADNKNEDIKHISEDVAKTSSLNTTEIIKFHDIIIVESDDYTTEELKNIVQKLIGKYVALENDMMPLLKYHGILDDGIVYSCYSKETCLWLKRVLSDFRVKDYRNTIDTHRLKIRVTNVNDNVNLLELLELYYPGIKSLDWTVLYEKKINGVLIFGVEMNTDSFRIVFRNNFYLFAGFDVAQFSIGC